MVNIKPPFYDGYWYCYSNSTAMLLGSIGENISSKLIEPLTGVGLGAMFHERSGLPFFSGAAGDPDKGITKALEILGFKFMEKNKEEGEAPFDELAEVLEESPAVIGPLNMSFLDYNPDRPKSEGVDHFILVYKIEGDKVFVNDPAGFAHVYISKEKLAKAWKADGIKYKRGHYRYWAKPERISTPTDEEIYQKAMEWFKELYGMADEDEKKDGTLINGRAIKHLVNLVEEDELKNYQIGFLNGFALPLGVKRALDYSLFFKGKNNILSELKLKQADLFGEAQSSLMYQSKNDLIENLNRLAEVEDQIRENF
ncbi:MAG: hypothetical protein US75_C0011G0011 [Candidatus Woesebacteria bacterium GW2011_GWC1_38_13]|uniref:Uncharacterized protein n=3 Tax=Candidatus Woeseibacteriota TaxID=1752722 RepID=A0A0G0L3J6_9BACT|nr:MAG: hypothetical protein US67_C0002G0020 [Candidatus Woesebacteria bacterium GW2011_GWD1_38_10]KKQ55994.1 MAG: hypothetical protein US75_C0011G0011 [Candidatus Woesebacteria bacterium GW2011_GWC1_38_13]